MDSETPAQASEPEAGVAELTADYFPAQPSTSEPASAEPIATKAEADVSPQAKTPDASQPQVQTADIQVGDRRYSVQEIQAALTSAQQLPHLTKVHMEAKRQLEEMQQAQRQQAAPQQPQLDPKSAMGILRAKYEPKVQQAVANGELSADFAGAFPAETTQFMAIRDTVVDIYQATQTLINRLNEGDRSSAGNAAMQQIDGMIANLTTQGEHFAQLADPAERGKFMEFLHALNPQVGQFQNPEFLPRMWMAYKQPDFVKQVGQAKAAADAAAKIKQMQRTNAAGVGTGTRPPTIQTEEPDLRFFDPGLLSDRFATPR